MNREIKFRQYDAVYGVMIQWEGDPNGPSEAHQQGLKDAIKQYGFEELANASIFMQYTGLKDKNGKEIYEGDIVTARERSDMATFTGYVHFLNAQYWVNYIGYESYYVPLIQLVNAVYKPIEVIGDIHENPDLLEVKP